MEESNQQTDEDVEIEGEAVGAAKLPQSAAMAQAKNPAARGHPSAGT